MPKIKSHSFRPCSSPDGQGLFLFHDLASACFLLFLFPFSFRSGGRKKDHFPLFSSSFLFGIGDRKNRSPFLFLLFFLFFCFFSPSFHSFFFFFSLFWKGVGKENERNFPLLFLVLFLFMEKRERRNWKKSKEILPLFRSFFLYFFFLFSLLIFSFLERKWGGKEVRRGYLAFQDIVVLAPKRRKKKN